MGNNEWKSFKMTFGKYSGDTMYMIYINDFSYIKYLDSLNLHPDVRSAVNEAIDHKNRTDPWSR